jgi:hypothetical protein
MAVTRFEGSGPVARYWLAHCEGFAVEGELRGTVEELIRDGDPYSPSRLLVRTRRGRSRLVPISAVAAVVPEQKTLVVSRPRIRRRRRESQGLPNLRVPVRDLSLRGFAVGSRATRTSALHTWRVARPAVLMLGDSLRLLGAEAAGSLLKIVRRR